MMATLWVVMVTSYSTGDGFAVSGRSAGPHRPASARRTGCSWSHPSPSRPSGCRTHLVYRCAAATARAALTMWSVTAPCTRTIVGHPAPQWAGRPSGGAPAPPARAGSSRAGTVLPERVLEQHAPARTSPGTLPGLVIARLRHGDRPEGPQPQEP